jgi:uncharacterized membrane protein
MTYCQSCGAPVEGRFCARCGASTAVGTGSTAASSPAAGISDNVASALCYVLGFITGVLFLVLSPYNQNRVIRFHAFQAIFLHLATIVISFAVPFIFQGASMFFAPLLWLGLFALWLYVILKAYQGQKFAIPVIGPLAEKQAG